MRRVTLSGLLCGGAIVIASASTLDPATIKRSPVKSQSFTYAMTGSIDLNGASHDIAAKEVDTIMDVASDGTITTKSEQSELTFDGMPAPTQGGTTTSVNKPTGELVSITADSGAGDPGRMASLTQFYYPAAPVSVGDTWSHTGTKNDKTGALDFKADMKYLGDEKVGSIDTWKIQEDVKETTGTPPATIHSTVWLDKTDGSMVKVESSFTDLPIAGFSISGKMNFNRK